MSMSKQEALKLLSEKVESATNDLTQCQKIADDYGLEFTIKVNNKEAASYRSRDFAIKSLIEDYDTERDVVESNLGKNGMYDHGDYELPEAGWLPNWISSNATC